MQNQFRIYPILFLSSLGLKLTNSLYYPFIRKYVDSGIPAGSSFRYVIIMLPVLHECHTKYPATYGITITMVSLSAYPHINGQVYLQVCFSLTLVQILAAIEKSLCVCI